MNNFMLEIDYSKPIEGAMQKFIFGGQMLLIGMLTIFAVLALIWLALVIFKTLFANLGKPAKAPEAPKPVIIAEPENNDEEIIAAIAAAIALAESETDDTKFRVVSFRKR